MLFQHLNIWGLLSPDYCRLNILPLVSRFRNRVKVWSKLWLSMAGRANLVKMIMMPNLLYFLHNTPVVIPLRIFRVVNSIFCSWLWKGGHARIKLEQLQKGKRWWGPSFPQPMALLYSFSATTSRGAMALDACCEEGIGDFTFFIMMHFCRARTLAEGLEAQLF